MMVHTTLIDSHGQRTSFEGELIGELDTYREDKPTWFEMIVYRTESDRYVVQRTQFSSLNHAQEDCPRLLGNGASTPVPADTQEHPLECWNCGAGKWAASDRVSVHVAESAQKLVDHLVGAKGANHVIRGFLADLSAADHVLKAHWMTRYVP